LLIYISVTVLVCDLILVIVVKFDNGKMLACVSQYEGHHKSMVRYLK
jgi:hypothetical protein